MDRGMLSFLKRFLANIPVPPKRDLPRTFVPPADDGRVTRPKVFEPALLHYRNAFRVGEPDFADPALAQAWRAARRRVMDHLLHIIATSEWREYLVLRGSMLIKAWFGEDARDPGDIDFTVTPHAKLISNS